MINTSCYRLGAIISAWHLHVGRKRWLLVSVIHHCNVVNHLDPLAAYFGRIIPSEQLQHGYNEQSQTSSELYGSTKGLKTYVFIKNIKKLFRFVGFRLFEGIVGFYSASALLAMQSAVLASGILSVRPSVRLSVCLSVTFRYCVQTNEDTIVRFSASGRTIPLVSEEVKFIRIFAGDHPQRGR